MFKDSLVFQTSTEDLIKNLLAIIAPITQLTCLHSRFQCSSEAQETYNKLRDVIFSASVLRHPDPALPYVLEVDASEVATGTVLSQR